MLGEWFIHKFPSISVKLLYNLSLSLSAYPCVGLRIAVSTQTTIPALCPGCMPRVPSQLEVQKTPQADAQNTSGISRCRKTAVLLQASAGCLISEISCFFSFITSSSWPRPQDIWLPWLGVDTPLFSHWEPWPQILIQIIIQARGHCSMMPVRLNHLWKAETDGIHWAWHPPSLGCVHKFCP